ncbi:MAG: helix-turn-helix transcriptional regulator [Acidimicrobiales bacterium]|nr:helix-turn-helix transcriptional regulator [Acidimicrobiales bacterium]
MAEEPVPLPVQLGNGVRRHRERAGLTRQEVADRAVRYGLRWSHQTLTAIERGSRRLTGEELLLLPWVLGCTPADLLEDATAVPLTDIAVVDGETASAVWRGSIDPAQLADIGSGADVTGGLRRLVGRVRADGLANEVQRVDHLRPGATLADVRSAELAAQREAEQKAARAVGLSPDSLALVAAGIWGRSLTEERDARLTARIDAGTAARTKQAVRGHIKRELLGALRKDVDGLDTPTDPAPS